MKSQKGGSIDDESKRILMMDQEDGSISGELIGTEH